MFEVLFFVGFVSVLLFTGVSFAGVILALSMGLTLLLIAGMFLLLLKLLPWILLALLLVWLARRYGPVQFRNREAAERYLRRWKNRR
ncbi:Phage shock protein G [Vibrio stylophorae]|uniref:Phage shock protein G n=1 Tax=Vibrio stylophorae TaxID=659351 RepID=A0ABM8ZQ40_9VIBR|nr:envelope stress response protein PspG [Vibrio stylophorae]CAH0532415.1 Phage shock protein G [Vibrio stylophorae]